MFSGEGKKCRHLWVEFDGIAFLQRANLIASYHCKSRTSTNQVLFCCCLWTCSHLRLGVL